MCGNGSPLFGASRGSGGRLLQPEDLCCAALETWNAKHKTKPEMTVSLDPMNLRKTCRVDSEATAVFFFPPPTELQRLMARMDVNHEVSGADSVVLRVATLPLR